MSPGVRSVTGPRQHGQIVAMHYCRFMAVTQQGFDITAVPADQSPHFGDGMLGEAACNGATIDVVDADQVAAMKIAERSRHATGQ